MLIVIQTKIILFYSPPLHAIFRYVGDKLGAPYKSLALSTPLNRHTSYPVVKGQSAKALQQHVICSKIINQFFCIEFEKGNTAISYIKICAHAQLLICNFSLILEKNVCNSR